MIKNNHVKKLLAKSRVQIDSSTELDFDFYRHAYPDLTNLNNAELMNHWCSFGRKEGRFPRSDSFMISNGLKNVEELDFDAIFYLNCYPDVKESGVITELQAKVHWIKYGKNENRFKTIDEWLNAYDHKMIIKISSIELSEIFKINRQYSFEQLMGTLCGHITHMIRFKPTSAENGDFYFELAESFFEESKKNNDPWFWYQATLKAATISYAECKATKVLELIACCHHYHGDKNTASKFFEYIYMSESDTSFTLEDTHIDNLLSLKRIEGAIKLIKQVIKKNPTSSYLCGKLDIASESLYLESSGELQLLALLDERKELCNKQYNLARTVYEAYYHFYRGSDMNSENVKLSKSLNNEKILIIGDYNVQQCVRYRIDQKIEQLEYQGKKITAINWTQLREYQNLLSLHDVVIFYRVPAVPQILKAMAQVNANGKASFYEIDDLLFEESYPAPIETYGGYIGLDTHIDLRKSMSSFRSAARFCRFGIASTKLLCEKLENLVFDKHCLLHRNGLDKISIIKSNGKIKKETINIFYGSGTQAHNSDFIELAMPALENVLFRFKNTRLIIAGYLKLPESFITKFKSQIHLLPPVNSVKAYWSFLELADINLAVLEDDEINGCKSELKWFEAACLGIPSIVSSTVNYRDVIHHGEDAFIAANVKEWKESLESLISSPRLREYIAAKAQARVQCEYNVDILGSMFVRQFENLVCVERNNKKKIALVNVFFPPQAIGGATRVVSDNFDVLQKSYSDDFDLVVFTSDEHCTTPYKLITYQYKGVRVYRSSVQYRENMDWHPKNPEMYKLFKLFLETEKPDLIHFHCIQRLTASVVEAAKDTGTPYIVTAHDAWWISDHQFLIDDNGNTYPEGHPDIYSHRTLPDNVTLGDSIERLVYFRELLNAAKKLLTVSDSFAGIYRKNGYSKIEINKNGISPTTDWSTKDTSNVERVICGHIGGMSNHKGYFLLKETVDYVQPENIEMLIVDHSKPEGYKHKTAWGKVPVMFIGRVSQINIVELYRKIDVLFAPSLWPESYGLVTREAAACGCWVVASDIGAISEDIIEGKTGITIHPNLDSLIEILRIIECDKKKYKKNVFSKNIRFVDEQVKELVRIYNDR
ncbi:glycosyltransferase [Grimontia hollisae]|uniref:glycosyltransferase n=1 Tax=Grimontia hollisae TaxID=673 RepID=UPI001302EEF7|nr:glycosyltransferase [Grimontia hollisae]MDF2184458.1 glycosyltransferase [Grimontia hollisae]